MTPLSSSGEPGDEQPQYGRGYIAAFVLLTMVVTMLSIADRSVITIVAEPIKRDLELSDTQLGLLTGFAFSLFFAVAGLPIARYVDRPLTNRPRIIAACIAVWSLLTAACGVATNYIQLVLARVFVGIGEGGASPAIITMINDTVPPARRARAYSFYSLAYPLGATLGLALGGLLVERFGWRATFVVFGAIGLPVAAAALWLIREPRLAPHRPVAPETKPEPLLISLREIVREPSIRYFGGAMCLYAALEHGRTIWTGVYLMRILEVSPTTVGLALGVTAGVAATLGALFGGFLVDWLSRRGRRHYLTPAPLAFLIAIPFAVASFLVDDWRLFVLLNLIPAVTHAMITPVTPALVQMLCRKRNRATALILFGLLMNAVGGGLGPLVIGATSDYLTSTQGPGGLRIILVVVSILVFVPALLLLKTRSYLDGVLPSDLDEPGARRVQASPTPAPPSP